MGYIRFKDPTDALTAYEAMDGRDLQGRLVRILPAADKVDRRTVTDGVEKKHLREKTAEKKKANAGREFNWAMLYMNVGCSCNDPTCLPLRPCCC